MANHEDVLAARLGVIPRERIRRARLSGVVDTGASHLALPGSVVTALGLPETRRIIARFADGRREEKTEVGEAELEILNRSNVFTAVVEPGREDALIGAIVLGALDLVPDCAAQKLVPRDPHRILVELD